MTRMTHAGVLLGLLALLLAGCGGSKKSESNEAKKTIAGVSANDHGTKQVSGNAEVELDDNYFSPTVLQGAPGSKVTLELKNEGQAEHNFSLDAQNIDKDLEAGKNVTVTVTMPQSGQVSFYCSYHKSSGMAGALEASG